MLDPFSYETYAAGRRDDLQREAAQARLIRLAVEGTARRRQQRQQRQRWGLGPRRRVTRMIGLLLVRAGSLLLRWTDSLEPYPRQVSTYHRS